MLLNANAQGTQKAMQRLKFETIHLVKAHPRTDLHPSYAAFPTDGTSLQSLLSKAVDRLGHKVASGACWVLPTTTINSFLAAGNS